MLLNMTGAQGLQNGEVQDCLRNVWAQGAMPKKNFFQKCSRQQLHRTQTRPEPANPAILLFRNIRNIPKYSELLVLL